VSSVPCNCRGAPGYGLVMVETTPAVAQQKRTPLIGLANSRAITSLLGMGVALDAGAKKLVSDAIASGAEPTKADKEAASLNRRSLAAALSWLKKAGSRLASLIQPRRRPGAYQRRRPLAKSYVNRRAEAARRERASDAGEREVVVPGAVDQTIV